MAVTLQDCRDKVYGIFRADQDDSSSYSLFLVDDAINSAYNAICNGTVMNPLTGKTTQKGQLEFLQTETYYNNVSNTSLTADTTVGATTLTVADTSNYLTAGKLFIEGNIVTYTGTTPTTFTGCTGVIFAFPSGKSVSPAYTIPTNYSSPINLTYNYRVKIPQKLYDDIFEDLNKYKGSIYGRNDDTGYFDNRYQVPPFYSIKDRSALLIYNLSQNDVPILFRYNKSITPLVNDTDAVMIDNDIYSMNTIPYLAAAEVLYNRDEQQRAAELYTRGCAKLEEMYTYYNNTSFESISGTQVGLQKGNINI